MNVEFCNQYRYKVIPSLLATNPVLEASSELLRIEMH